MYLLLAILIVALAATLYRRARAPSPLWSALLLLEILVALGLISLRLRPHDIAQPYQAVFRASGYGLGRLLADDPAGVAGPLLVLVAGEGEVDQWRIDGLRKALEGTDITVGESVTLPMDPQSGCFAAADVDRVLAEHPDVTRLVAFAGLRRAPASSAVQAIYIFHPTSVDNMEEGWRTGVVKAVAAPSGDAPPAPARGEPLDEVFRRHFKVRTTR